MDALHWIGAALLAAVFTRIAYIIGANAVLISKRDKIIQERWDIISRRSSLLCQPVSAERAMTWEETEKQNRALTERFQETEKIRLSRKGLLWMNFSKD